MKPVPSLCKVGNTLDIFVGKWKTIILLHLLIGGTKRFSELKSLIPEITQKVLTAQLRELEEQDIVERHIYPEVPPRVEYSITEYGKTLQPILNMMHEWGESHKQHMNEKHKRQDDAMANES